MKNNQSSLSYTQKLTKLTQILTLREDITLSLLFGSRARGDNNEQSDWDIAILFKDNSCAWDNLGKLEEIRHLISLALEANNGDIDLVDLYRGGLGINATVVDEGIPLTGTSSIDLAYYYQRIWANLEDFYWNVEHVS